MKLQREIDGGLNPAAGHSRLHGGAVWECSPEQWVKRRQASSMDVELAGVDHG